MSKRVILIIGIIALIAGAGLIGMRIYTKSFSPEETVKQSFGQNQVEITYSRPFKKDREIFGGLVPWNEVWRTGANEATTFEIRKAVNIEGRTLPAGEYALFSIPAPEQWMIIFNKDADQWGAFNYDPSLDQLRIRTQPEDPGVTVEQFTINLIELDQGVRMELLWEDQKVSLEMFNI